jgi:hypothetical protein
MVFTGDNTPMVGEMPELHGPLTTLPMFNKAYFFVSTNILFRDRLKYKPK